MIHYLSQAEKNKLKGVALLRLDFNSEDDWRVRASLPTIKFLLKEARNIIILTHRGRPEVKLSKEKNNKKFFQSKDYKKHTLKSYATLLSKLLRRKINFISFKNGFDCKKISQFINSYDNQIFLLENLRFLPGEEKNSSLLARQLAKLGDYYVNDAFAVSHRKNASVYAIAKFLPSYAGLEMEKEIKNLSYILKNSKRPLTIVLGGAKISDKVGVIKYFWRKADFFVLGGGPANTFLAAKKIPVGDSLVDSKAIPLIRKFLFSKKINLPVDFKINVGKIFDIGPITENNYRRIIKRSHTVVWSGPMGFFEKKEFSGGTKSIWEAIFENKRLIAIVGGGETISSLSWLSGQFQNEKTKIKAKKILKELELRQKHSLIFLSTGGGAMLKFLSGENLPGIEALDY